MEDTVVEGRVADGRVAEGRVAQGRIVDNLKGLSAVVPLVLLEAEAIPAAVAMEERFQCVAARPTTSVQAFTCSNGLPVPQPDAAVKKLEDELVKATRDKDFDGFPGRRSYGTAGKAIVLRTNYFQINPLSDPEKLFYYTATISSGAVSKDKKRKLFECLLTQLESEQDGLYATDYGQYIVTTERLDIVGDGSITKTIVLPSDNEGPNQATDQPDNSSAFAQESRRRNTFNITLANQGTLKIADMDDYLTSEAAGTEYLPRQELIQMMNIILMKRPNESQNVAGTVGRNKFFPLSSHEGYSSRDLSGGLVALRGYYLSVRPATGRLLLNMNVVRGAFFRPGKLIELIRDSDNNPNDHKRQAFFIRGLKVEARYIADGKTEPSIVRKRTIVGFAETPPFGNAHQTRFPLRDPAGVARTISVLNYFKEKHGITLKAAQLPVLNVGTRENPQYLPQEICWVPEGQQYRGLLNASQTTEMLAFAAKHPNVNATYIAGTENKPGVGMQLFSLDGPPGHPDPQNEIARRFGFEVLRDMIIVPASILQAPHVKYATKSEQPRGGSWNVAQQKFARPGSFKTWATLVLHVEGHNALGSDPTGDMEALEKDVETLEKSLRTYGLNTGSRLPTRSLELKASSPDNPGDNEKKLHDRFKLAAAKGIAFLFIVLPYYDKRLHACIKLFADSYFGIHTICAIGSKFQKEKGQAMYMGNLALKFNIKSGGINHTVQEDILAKPLNDRTIVFGIDVTHPSPGSAEGAPSLAAVVASTDKYFAQWPGSVERQSPGNEMVGEQKRNSRSETVNSLEEMVLERLKLWREKNNCLPENVVVFRDGVSEGQYRLVLDNELPSFQKAFGKLYGSEAKWPKITIVVVSKRHHTRFYPTQLADADYDNNRKKGSMNPLPGTVVDRGITGRVLYEFYLQAHQGLQGTARPAKYSVIKDDIKFEANELQQFTHRLCYLFSRATKAVSVCPPAYYADLLAARAREYSFDDYEGNRDAVSGPSTNFSWDGTIHEKIKNSTFYI